MKLSTLKLQDVQIKLANGRQLFNVKKLEIQPGEKILIRGASGTGKSTFLHLLAGLILPQKGSYLIGEQRVELMSDDERCAFRRRSVGLIFQKLNILDHLSVRENIELLGFEHRKLEERVLNDVLAEVGLTGRADDRCGVLSLGEQQRVAVARLLFQRPDLILADEPTSSLDRTNSDSIIRSLLATAVGRTLIVVSHDERIEKHFTRKIDFSEFAR